MNSLVIANLCHRPVRLLSTAFGVSIGTMLVLLMTGLAEGMLNDRNARDTNTMAEILVRPPGSFSGGLSSNLLSMPVEYARMITAMEGVAAAAPIGQYMQTTESGIGFRAIEAVDYESYVAASGISMVVGSRPQTDDEVMIDEGYAQQNQLKPGDTVRVLDKSYRIAGIYAPAVGARIKLTLSELQKITSAEDRCSLIMVRCKTGYAPRQVAAQIADKIPDVQIIFTEDIPRLTAESLPMLDQFLTVVVAISVFVSSLVILLSMYTAVLERTREIGILKSLGASNAFIVWTLQKEAVIISLLGVAIGCAVSLLARELIVIFTTLKDIQIGLKWIFLTTLLAIVSALVGALYPALKAASQDPVEALSYE